MNKNVPCTHPLAWRFSDKQITAWGGFRLVEQMLRHVGFRALLQKSSLPQPGSNCGLDPAHLLESFLVTIWTGGTRFAHTALVRFDPVLSKIFGWKKVPCVSTFTRFFRRFHQRQVHECFGEINRWFWQQVTPGTVTLDLDSTVITRYGVQEGSQLGYNPHRRGKPCQHPLLAFVSDWRLVVHGWMRPGNTNAASNAENFFRETLGLLGPEHPVGLVRADSGFAIDGMLNLFEEKKLSYIVAARAMKAMRRQLAGIKEWLEIDGNIAASEISYQAAGWKSARRVVVIRHNDKGNGRWLLEVPGYTYSIYLTNLSLPAVEVWRLYRGRADSENRIKELGEDFGMRGFALQDFWATEAAFQSVLLAYNLFGLFRQMVLGSLGQKTLSSLRFECVAIGAALGREGKKAVLRLSLPRPRRAWIEGLFSKIYQITSPWIFRPLKT